MSVSTSIPVVPIQVIGEPNLWCRICTPAQLYVILTAISIIALVVQKQFMAIPVKLVFALIYTFLLNWFCDKGWTTLSWVLVILPFIAMLIVVAVFLYSGVKNKLTQKKHEAKK
jgi:hypothetical protein